MKIELGIYAIIFFLPLYLVRLSVFGIPSTILELLIFSLFIIWLVKNFNRYFKTEIHPNPPLRKEGVIPFSDLSREVNKFPPLQRGIKGDLINQSLGFLKKEKFLTAGILLLLSGALISTIFSSEFKTSAGILKGWFLDPFLLFIILISEIKTVKQKENILKAFFLSGLAVASASLLYWFFPEWKGVTYDGRLQGFYLSPNYLAMYLSPAFIIGIWLFFKLNNVFFSVIPSGARNLLDIQNSENKRFLPACWQVEMTKCLHFLFQSDKILWFISSITIAIALYFTYSYSAWISVFIAVIILVYYLFIESAVRKKVYIFSICFALFISLIFSQAGNDKFNVLKSFSYRSSFNSRIMIWSSAWEIGKDNWLAGIGPGNFQKYYLDYQAKFTEPYLEWAVPQPHNIFLAFWLETGLIGLLGFIVILAWFFKLSMRNFKIYLKVKIPPNLPLQREEQKYFPPLQRGIKGDLCAKQPSFLDKENYLLTAVLLSLMIYTLTHGLFDTTYWKNDLAMIFWINLGLLATRFNHLTFRI